MSHEQSETVEQDGKYYNVYGRNVKGKSGKQLPGTKAHNTLEEAVSEAKKRSEAFSHDIDSEAARPVRKSESGRYGDIGTPD